MTSQLYTDTYTRDVDKHGVRDLEAVGVGELKAFHHFMEGGATPLRVSDVVWGQPEA